MFKRYKLISILVIIILASMSVMGSVSAAQDTFRLRLATVVSPPHPWIDMAEYFVEEVEVRTDGNVTTRIYHSGSLGNDEATIDEMRIGTVDFVIGGLANAVAFLPEYQITGFPYLFEGMEHFRKVIDPNNLVFQYFQNLHEERNIPLILLSLAGGGTRVTSTNYGAVSVPEDIRGVKMRLPANPLSVQVWETLGAIPTTLPWGDIYSALQTGLVDAFESTISGYYGSKLYEVAPHQSMTNHQIMISHFTMSRSTYNKLPEQYQKIIKEVAIKAGELGTEKGEIYDSTLQQEMVEKYGLNVYDVDIPAFVEVLEPLHDELAENVGVTDLLEIIRDLK